MPVADSDMAVDSGLPESRTPSSAGSDSILPASLCSPAADILKNFYHTKRVGNYLIGRKLGEGSFAKVREGLHAMTGEKVWTLFYLEYSGCIKYKVYITCVTWNVSCV